MPICMFFNRLEPPSRLGPSSKLIGGRPPNMPPEDDDDLNDDDEDEEDDDEDELFITDIEEPNGVVSTLWLLAAVAS